MPLDSKLVVLMKQVVKFGPEEIDGMLRKLEEADPSQWRQSINLAFLTLWTDHLALRKQMSKLAPLLALVDQAEQQAQQATAPASAAAAPAAAGAPATPPPAVVGAPATQNGGTRIGADGTPIVDPSQIAAEELLDQATGTAPPAPAGPPQGMAGTAPSLRRRNGGGQARGPRIGADGTPIVDPAQLDAEELMDNAVGP